MRNSFRYACAVAVLVLLACGACHSKPQLPADPGLARDSFGVGATLGMDYAAAQSAVAAEPGIEFWLLTREELSDRSPYTERPAGKDLAVVIYDGAPGSGAGTVRELRFYLAEPDNSRVRLLGKNAAPLKPADIIAWLGEPLNTSTASDGRTHLTYYFAPAQKGDVGIKLITSHEPDGRCFAFAVSLEQQLPR
jgi:hypothetical protein